jgi:hypothetical protein
MCLHLLEQLEEISGKCQCDLGHTSHKFEKRFCRLPWVTIRLDLFFLLLLLLQKIYCQDLVLLRFHYQMYKGEVSNKNYPIQIGNLSVIVQVWALGMCESWRKIVTFKTNLMQFKNSFGNRVVVWTVNGTQGMDWKVVSINVPLKAPTSILSIEAQLIGWSYGDIAIDNIRLRKQPCRRQRKSA